MRFSFLVAAEFFFSSLIFVGFAGCLGFEDIESELTTFFLEKENIMKYDEFKCRKDSPSGLLLKANININGEINPEYELLLCLEEFMYAFRSFFEDRIKGEADQQDLFDNFCKYVAGEIKSDNRAFDDNSPDDKRKKACDVLFLNLCKLFFIDKENDVWGDVRYFRFIFKLLYNDQEHIPKYLNAFISHVYQRLRQFVDNEEKLKTGKFKELDTPGLLGIDDREKNQFFLGFFSDTEETLFENEEVFTFPEKKTKEIFYLNNSFTSGKLMHKEIEKGCVVLIYDDFVVFENKEFNEEIVWKRERKNRATPYSFYRLLSKEEILEIDIFAKNPDKKVIDVLEKEIKEQMLYDFNILCSQITEFISCFKYPKDTFESILKECACYVKEKHPWGKKENIGDIEKKIKSYFMPQEQRRDEYVVYPSDDFEKDNMLTEELWLFLSLVAKGFYKVISNIFNTFKDDFKKAPWFKGLKNLGNSCYINALSQNLFDYEKEMQDMVNDTFLGQMHQLQRGENKGFSKDFAKITEYNGTQQDSHELFKKIFIPKSIEENEKMMPYATKTSIKEGNKQRKGYNSFLFRFDSKFECLEANAIKEEGGNEERSFHNDFNNANKKKEFKSIHDVLNCIYDYLNTYYCNLSLFYTTIDTYCDHKGTGEDDCCKKYDITITKSSEIEVDSYEVYNGLDLLSCLAGKRKEKISGSCDYYHQGKDVDIYREQTYHNFSDFLVIHLKRFTSDNNVIPNSIPIPDNICFDGDRYDITGLVCHSGGTSSGHYIAYKKKFGLWFKFNDSAVSILGSSLPDEAVKCAYMLFFKKNKEINDDKKDELKTKEENDIRSNENYQIKRTEGGMRIQEAELKRKEMIRKQAEEERRRIQEGELKRKEMIRKQVEEERKKKGEEELKKKEEMRKQAAEKLQKEKEELGKNKRKIFLSELLQYYYLFNTKYFEIKNKDGKTFMEYLQNIVEEKNEDLEKQPYASLLLQVQKYFNLRNSIRGIDRNSNKLNEIHEEKVKVEELEILEKDIIKNPNLCKFYEENNMRPFLKEFVKVFFISFCDFDNTCEKPLFKKENLKSLKEGAVEFFFEKDKNINIPDNRELPFFLITNIPIKDQQNGVGENNSEEGETMPAPHGDGKYYCFWSDKLIIAQDENDDSLLNTVKNEINEDNKINMHKPQDVDDDYGSFKNLALFKKTSEVGGCGFFERFPDEECRKYSIENIVGEVKEERNPKLNHLLSFIGKIENFINETDVAINECQEKIKNEDQEFFTKKKDEIKTKYNQQIDDLGKCIDIADEYKKKLVQAKGDLIEKQEENKKTINEVNDEIIKIAERLKDQGVQSNIQGDLMSKSKTQVSGGGKDESIQPGDYTNELKELEKKLKALCVEGNYINDSICQVESVVNSIENLIKYLNVMKEGLMAVLKYDEINFELYKARLASYSPYYKVGKNKKEGENKKDGKEVLTVLDQLKIDINAVLESNGEYTIKSFNINIKDIINPFNSFPFDRFVSTIKGKISEIISGYLIRDLYEYLCFGKETSKRVLVGSEQRFKGLQNLGNTCYINSILQNLVEFKDDLLLIKNCPKDKGADKKVETIHDEVFDVLAANRIGLHNVLNISTTNGFLNTNEPSEVYSSLLNYYIINSYKIEVVEGSKGKDFVYEPLKENATFGFNAKLFLPLVDGENKEINDIDIINYLYNNEEFKKRIKEYIPVSQAPCVFNNNIIRTKCEKCLKTKIKIEIECSPYCMINIVEIIGKANNISDVVKEKFGIAEEDRNGIDCDCCTGEKTAKLKSSSCYRVMNNCLWFYFVVSDYDEMNSIDIEDEVKVGDEVYESVCACYYSPGHHIAFKKINDIWFVFDDYLVYPTIYKSLPKMYYGFKPILVFYKKKIEK